MKRSTQSPARKTDSALVLDAEMPAPGKTQEGITANKHVLRRTLGVSDAVMLILSSVIGVGIFLTPKEIAVQVSNPYWFLFLWLVGGLVALSGAMSSAALGTMLPRAGGDYVFLRTAYGPAWGFLYGYLCFVITFTGSIAALAVGVVHYQGPTILKEFLPAGSGNVLGADLIHLPALGYDLRLEQIAAIVLVLLFTLVNHFGTKKSLKLQKVITMVPIVLLAIAGLMILYNLLIAGDGSKSLLARNFRNHDPLAIPPLSAAAMAMIPIFFTYTGWNAALYLGEDIKTPRKIIPRALMIGLAIVAAIYFLFCTVFLSTIPYEVLHDKSRDLDIASYAWGFLFGGTTQFIMAGLIAVLILGSLNSSIITGSRIFFAMGRDRIFFTQAGHVHPKHGTPSWSLWAQAAWTCVIILVAGSFQKILQYTTVAITLMSMVTISSLFVLRGRLKRVSASGVRDRQRMLGYPFAPAFYIISTGLILIGFLSYKPENVIKGIVGLGIIALGFLIYYVWRRTDSYIADRRGRNGSR